MGNKRKTQRSGIDESIFPENDTWFDGTYANLKDMFGSFEYFARYIKKRFPKSQEIETENYNGIFFIENIDVIFCPEVSRISMQIAFASNHLVIKVPDRGQYDDQEKDELREHLFEKYFSRVKESHTRILALLWKLLDDEEQKVLAKNFPSCEEV